MTPEQTLKLCLMLFPCIAAVLMCITAFTWHYWHAEGIRDHERRTRETENDASRRTREIEIDAERRKREGEANAAQAFKRMETEAVAAAAEAANDRDTIMRQIATDYALFCPGCGKVMSLHHASRLPAEAQAQFGYVPPTPPTEKEEEEPARRNKRRT